MELTSNSVAGNGSYISFALQGTWFMGKMVYLMLIS